MVFMCVEAFSQQFIGNELCMQKPIHAKHNFEVDSVILFEKVMELVLLDDFLKDVAESHDEFRAFERSVEVEVYNVHTHEVSTSHGDDSVQKNFWQQAYQLCVWQPHHGS